MNSREPRRIKALATGTKSILYVIWTCVSPSINLGYRPSPIRNNSAEYIRKSEMLPRMPSLGSFMAKPWMNMTSNTAQAQRKENTITQPCILPMLGAAENFEKLTSFNARIDRAVKNNIKK